MTYKPLSMVPFTHPWPEKPLGDVATVVVGGTPSTDVPAYWGGDIPWMASGDVHQKRITDVEGRITSLGLRSSNATLVEPPSVAVALAGQGKTRGTAAKVLTRLCANQSVALIAGKPGELHQDYLFHNLDFRYEELRGRSSGGGRGGLSKGILEDTPIPTPDFAEQARIAEVLDTLDEAIRKTADIIAKRLVARQGLIRDLLTYGVDQNGERRDPRSNPSELVPSNLGLVPKTWTIKVLSSCCLAVVDCPHSTPNFLDQGVLVARTMHIKDGQFDTRLASRVSEEEYQTRVSRIEPAPGDVIFTREAPVGEAFVIPDGMRICLGQRVMLLRPDPQTLLGDYLVSQIYSGAVQSRIKLLTGGTTNPHLNVAEVRAFPIPIPPIQEQRILVRYLREFEHSIEAEKEQLRKLETLKSGLTSDLLTGKVRTS